PPARPRRCAPCPAGRGRHGRVPARPSARRTARTCRCRCARPRPPASRRAGRGRRRTAAAVRHGAGRSRGRRSSVYFRPMPHHTSLIAMLVAGFVLAFVLGALANRLRLSPLVGYLLAGIVAGPYTPGFVGDAEIAPQLAEIGVILLMFGVGLHFSLRDLLSVRGIAIPGAVAQITVATTLGWGLALLMGWGHMAGLVFGFSLATASTVVLLRAMEERRLLDTRRGRIAVGWLIVEDIACVVALVLIPALAGALGDGDATAREIGMALLFTFLKVGAFVAFMLLVGRRVIPWLLERIAGTGSRELFTLCVLAIAMGGALGSAELFGVSFALGAFFAGMLLNESEFSSQAAQDSMPMRDAFAVLFFVSVGMLFDPIILFDHPWQVV